MQTPGARSTRPLSQIDASNVSDLQVAWRWSSPENALAAENPKVRPGWYEATPLVVDGVLYTSTSHSGAVALDPGTGEQLWAFDSESQKSGRPPNTGFVHRGLSHWGEGRDARIFLATGNAHLFALDLRTGEPVGGFGKDGRVDLLEGLRREVRRRYYGVTSPPIVCKDVIVTGASISDLAIGRNAPPGDVRGFDVRTGRQLWTFHSVPQEGNSATTPGRTTPGRPPATPTCGA